MIARRKFAMFPHLATGLRYIKRCEKASNNTANLRLSNTFIVSRNAIGYWVWSEACSVILFNVSLRSFGWFYARIWLFSRDTLSPTQEKYLVTTFHDLPRFADVKGARTKVTSQEKSVHTLNQFSTNRWSPAKRGRSVPQNVPVASLKRLSWFRYSSFHQSHRCRQWTPEPQFWTQKRPCAMQGLL